MTSTQPLSVEQIPIGQVGAGLQHPRLGMLPERYRVHPRDVFNDSISRVLRPGIRILDIGSGRTPAVAPKDRPPGCHYVGLDISAEELAIAPAGSYDETWVVDVTRHMPELDGRFDLVLSWQVLEHVRPVDAAIANTYSYLAPGGSFVGMLSASFAAFAVANRIIPDRVARLLMKRLHNRDPESVFPAHYDRCWYGAIGTLLTSWQDVEIIPFYCGAVYFGFSGVLRRRYLGYENWAARGSHRNLATHYVIAAVR